ncbi:MAG: hypothetical protein WCJ58_06545 [bacterium]
MATLFSKTRDNKLSIEFDPFQFSESKAADDKEWIRGNLLFENASFSAAINNQPQFYLSQLKKLIADLEKILAQNQGEVDYSGMEPYLNLTISLTNTGSANIEGTITDLDNQSGKLSFIFESDQSCLRAFAEELRRELVV